MFLYVYWRTTSANDDDDDDDNTVWSVVERLECEALQ